MTDTCTCGGRAMHEIWRLGVERSLCCACYVAEGNPPADWHSGCMEASAEPHETPGGGDG